MTEEQLLEIQKTYIAFNKKQKERLTSLTDARNDKLFEKYFDQVIRFDPLNPDQYLDPNEISNAKFIGKKGIEFKKQLLSEMMRICKGMWIQEKKGQAEYDYKIMNSVQSGESLREEYKEKRLIRVESLENNKIEFNSFFTKD